ncbi:MAG: c-type cytochrome, partial [Verrucomicrobia bacterium]|nr:c-type cytochrome [Verrucomicrobiota bacterium]
SRYGCYSCHQISGFESVKPIGTELSEWGSKATDKLDFGYLEKEMERNNYAYLAQKLRAARSFDRTDTRRPQEWMRMPQFNFTGEQIEDIVTAVMGMTDEKVTDKAKQKLSSFDWEIESGRWLAQQYNCQGCHVLERRGGAIRGTIEDPAFYPPDLFAQGARTQPEWLFKFLKEPTPIRPRLFARARMPTFEFTDEQANTLVKYFSYLDNQDFPFEKDYVLERHPDVEKLNVGKQLFQKLQCVKCHNLRPGQQLTPEQANQQFPSLVLVRDRLKPKWVADWMRDPNYFQKGTQMPAFWPDGASPFPDILGGNAQKQMEAVRDYMFVYQGEDLGQPAAPAAPAPAAKPAGKPAANPYE